MQQDTHVPRKGKAVRPALNENRLTRHAKKTPELPEGKHFQIKDNRNKQQRSALKVCGTIPQPRIDPEPRTTRRCSS